MENFLTLIKNHLFQAGIYLSTNVCYSRNMVLIISLQTYKERKLEGHSVLDDPMSKRDLVVYRGEKQQQ